jgi:RecA/RadA recombinase
LVTINVAVLLAVVAFFRLRRRTQARSRNEEMTTAVIILALGVLLAPTPVGQAVVDILGELSSGVTQASR